jgi:hypothetical protein
LIEVSIPSWRSKRSDTAEWKKDPDFSKFFPDAELAEIGVSRSEIEESFVWPSKGDEQILQSLMFHTRRHWEVKQRLDAPNHSEKKFVLNTLEEVFSRPISNYWRERKPVNPTWAWFCEALKEVEMDSSPGWPWKQDYKDNRAFLYTDESPNIENWQLLYIHFLNRLSDLKVGPKADDINVFIKNELHKRSKKEQGAWRLISAISLTDCMVDRWLFGDFFNALYEKEGWQRSPNKAGWAPVRGGFKWFYERYRVSRKKVYMADKSSWDWTMQAWLVEVITDFLVRVCSFSDPALEVLIRNRLMATFRTAIFNVGGHTRLFQAVMGIMKSGLLGTIIINGFAQVCLDVLAKLRLQITGNEIPDVGGDDTVQECPHYVGVDGGIEYIPETYTRELQNAGCIVKEFEVVEPFRGEPIEFFGTVFNSLSASPAYKLKHLGALMTATLTKCEALSSYQRLYAFDNFMFPRLTRWLLHLGGEAVSQEYAREWYRGEVLSTEDYWKLYKVVE